MTAAPGLFFHLVREGVVAEEALAPLVARLPEEACVVVTTGPRPGEAIDSLRWPVARDAALARLVAARQLDDAGRLAAALREIDAADAAALKALARRAFARWFAATGGNAELLARIHADVTPGDTAVFAEAPWPADVAEIASDLTQACAGAADGLYAYHAHRRLPGFAADAAARLARRAIERGVLTSDELVAAAIALL